MSASSVVDVPIVYRDNNAILRLDGCTNVVSILTGADRSGKNKVAFQQHVNNIINIETRVERHERQLLRSVERNGNEVDLRAVESNAMAAANADADDIGCFSRPSKSGKYSNAGGAEPTTASGEGSASVPSAVAGPQPFFLYYISASHKIQAICFSSRGGPEQLQSVVELVQTILRQVYVLPRGGGIRELVVFVSPISGSGQAKVMWEKEVLPVLYLSKHKLRVIVTERQAHCEGYVADLSNALDARHVVVAVGGDGMVHEAVNGLQRRRSALRASSLEDSLDELPIVATIPAGSGCALAKAFNILHPVEAAKALVHLNSTCIDLLHITFVPCEHNFVPTREEVKAAKKLNRPEPRSERRMTAVVDKPRHAFLNCCFAITNEIDKGSEHMRWMGNARFTVKAMQLLAAGLPLYRCRVRYIPWTHHVTGERVEKLEESHTLPKKYPKCTGRDGCEHCQQNRQRHASVTTELVQEHKQTPPSEALSSSSEAIPAGTAAAAAADTRPEWVELPENRFALLMLNNLVDAARDMAIAPLAHVGDGAIDVVFNGKRPGEADNMSRTEFVKVFLGLEEGSHIHEPGVRYVKAQEVEVLPEDGMVMADGELLPTSGVRVKTIPAAVRVVRSL